MKVLAVISYMPASWTSRGAKGGRLFTVGSLPFPA